MLGELLPLPGVFELEGIVRGLIQRSKDLSYEEDKRLELAARLENLISCAKHLDDLSELNKTLCDIQNRLESVLKSGSRPGIYQARRKIAAWEELNRRLDRVMEVTLLRLVAQPRNARVEHGALEYYENKLPVIPAYEIVEQAEIFAQGFCGLHDGEYYLEQRRLDRDVAPRYRSGRFGKLSVTYKTFADCSANNTVKRVREDLDTISRMLHPNVAVLAGITQGYNGLNGFIAVTEGLPIGQFVLGARGGTAWAKCIKGLEAFDDAYFASLFCPGIESITVQANGHVTVLPSSRFTPLLACPNLLRIYVPFKEWGNLDPVVMLMQEIYSENYRRLGTRQLRRFVDSCRNLGPGSTELEVTRIAACSEIFPLPTRRLYSWSGAKGVPSFILHVGDLGQVQGSQDDFGWNCRGWRSLGASRHLTQQDFVVRYVTRATLIQTETSSWLSYSLSYDPRTDNFVSVRVEFSIPNKFKCSWENIFLEAQELSECHEIPVDTISLCKDVGYSILMDCRLNGDEYRPDEQLYFHRNPCSDDPCEFWGFLSPSNDPTCHVWQGEFERRGWIPIYSIQFSTYDVSNDWNIRYEKLLESGLAAIPGSYPGAHIEDVS